MELNNQSIIQAIGAEDATGGTIQIDTRKLMASDSSEIQVIADGNRLGGSITLNASEQVALDGQSKILAIANQDAPVGNITITTGTLSLDNAEISTRTLKTGANIRLEASQQIQLNNGSLLSAIGDETGGMQGGTITIMTPTLEALSESDNDIRARAQFDPVATSETIQFNSIDLSGVESIINFNQEPVVHTSVPDNIQNILNQIDTALPSSPPPTPTPIPTPAPIAISTPASITPGLRAIKKSVAVSSPAPPPISNNPPTPPVSNNPQSAASLQPSISRQPTSSPQPSPSTSPTTDSTPVLSASPYIHQNVLTAALDGRLADAYNWVSQQCTGDVAKGSHFVITGRGGLVPSPKLSLADDAPLEDLRPEDLRPGNLRPSVPSTSSATQFFASSSLPLSRRPLRLGLSTDSLHTAGLQEANRWRQNQRGQVQLMAASTSFTASLGARPTCGKTRG